MSTPLAGTHFRKGLGAERPSGNMAYVTIFSIVAAFILAIASINYMNMATARSANRAKEVGIRKVLGADKKQLVWQFISESVVLSIIALVIAYVLVLILMPDFNDFTGKMLSLKPAGNLLIYFEIFVIAIIYRNGSRKLSGILSFIFSAGFCFKRNRQQIRKRKWFAAKVLVVIQFFIAIFMIIGTLVVSEPVKLSSQ